MDKTGTENKYSKKKMVHVTFLTSPFPPSGENHRYRKKEIAIKLQQTSQCTWIGCRSSVFEKKQWVASRWYYLICSPIILFLYNSHYIISINAIIYSNSRYYTITNLSPLPSLSQKSVTPTQGNQDTFALRLPNSFTLNQCRMTHIIKLATFATAAWPRGTLATLTGLQWGEGKESTSFT